MEILDLYDINGNLLGKSIARGEKTSDGEYIKLTAIWIKSGDKYLIQKTSKQKGSVFAVTGGHVPQGVNSKTQAKIEIEEELGLTINVEDLKLIEENVIIKRKLGDIYSLQDDSLINFEFKLQESEVDSVYWMTKEEIEKLISDGSLRKSTEVQYLKFIKAY